MILVYALIKKVEILSRYMFKIVMLLGLLLASCTTVPTDTLQYADPVLLTKPHTILAGEQIKVTVFGQLELSGDYRVDDRGQISMPLIGIVAAYGKTPSQMSEYIAFLLGQKFLRNPSVSVEMIVYTPIYITGAIRSPGQFVYSPGVTAGASIASAGGFLKSANKVKVRITRRENGRVSEATVALQTPLAAGDIVQVFGDISTN